MGMAYCLALHPESLGRRATIKRPSQVFAIRLRRRSISALRHRQRSRFGIFPREIEQMRWELFIHRETRGPSSLDLSTVACSAEFSLRFCLDTGMATRHVKGKNGCLFSSTDILPFCSLLSSNACWMHTSLSTGRQFQQTRTEELLLSVPEKTSLSVQDPVSLSFSHGYCKLKASSKGLAGYLCRAPDIGSLRLTAAVYPWLMDKVFI